MQSRHQVLRLALLQTHNIHVRNVFGRVRHIVVILVGLFFPFSFESRLHFGTKVLRKQTLLQIQHKNSQKLKYPCSWIDWCTILYCPLRWQNKRDMEVGKYVRLSGRARRGTAGHCQQQRIIQFSEEMKWQSSKWPTVNQPTNQPTKQLNVTESSWEAKSFWFLNSGNWMHSFDRRETRLEN